jgi:hypothetical protein
MLRFLVSSHIHFHMFASTELANAWIGIQSFILTTYMFLLALVDFMLKIILPIDTKVDNSSEDDVSDSSERSKRQRLRRLRHKLSGRHLSPTVSP